MTYYRIAGRLRKAAIWRWRTTKPDSLQAVWDHLERYRWPDRTELRIFFASSPTGLEEMLLRANAGNAATSVPAERVVRGLTLPNWEQAEAEKAEESQKPPHQVASTVLEDAQPRACATTLTALDVRRLELELGAGGDHDVPYRFAWPVLWPQASAWIGLRARGCLGETFGVNRRGTAEQGKAACEGG